MVESTRIPAADVTACQRCVHGRASYYGSTGDQGPPYVTDRFEQPLSGYACTTLDITYWGFRCPDASQALARRNDFICALQLLGAQQPDLFASELIYGELVGNVVRHSPGPIEVRVEMRTQDGATLHVIDSGEAFDAKPYSADQPWGESGRGLFLITAFGSGVLITPQSIGKCVSARLPFANDSEPDGPANSSARNFRLGDSIP